MYSNILVPLAFDENHEASTQPLETAKGLCAEGGKITIVHVFETPPAYAMQYVAIDILKSAQKDMRRSMSAMVEGLPNVDFALLSGSPGRAITDYAAKNNTDLIVMASHEPGISDIVWGSTAAFVVRHVGCSVHVMR